jgi:hypothetical protein
MTKQEGSSSPRDLKQVFEVAISVLHEESKSVEPTVRGNRALVQRAVTDENLKKRAVADAARALTALWKIHTQNIQSDTFSGRVGVLSEPRHAAQR